MGEYFQYLTGLEPTDDQIRVLNDLVEPKVKKMIISAGRQSGKTLTTAVGIMWWLFESGQKVKILLVSPQDNILYFHLREIFKAHQEFEQQLTDISKLSPNIIPLRGFELKNGNIVFVRGTTDKNIRGVPADIVIIDEACEVMNDRILTALGNLSGSISKFVLLSTPHVNTSLFVKWASLEGEEQTFKKHQWSSENLSWHDKELLATKKKELSAEKYAVEVEGRPPTKSERSFFPHKHIDDCVKPVDSIREGGTNSRLEIGIDWGYDPNPTVLILTERIGTTKRKVLEVKVWKLVPIEELGPQILEYIRKTNPYLVKADSRPSEYKAWFGKHGKGKIKFIDLGIGHKDQMLGQLQRMIRERRIIIPHEWITLVDGLRKYRKVKAEGTKTPKSDYVEALALSIYEPSVPLEGGSYGKVHFPSSQTLYTL